MTATRRASLAGPRRDAELEAEGEIEAWRAHVLPDPTAPLEAEDLARLVRGFVSALAIDPKVAENFSVNTVHYYRRKDILDAPEGRTSSARYGIRHLWQAIGARLAGHLGLVTLAEAREVMRGADEETLRRFVAARVADERARQATRRPAPRGAELQDVVRPLGSVARRAGPAPSRIAATVVSLPGDAWCVVPAAHPAHHSPTAARALAVALAAAFNVSLEG